MRSPEAALTDSKPARARDVLFRFAPLRRPVAFACDLLKFRAMFAGTRLAGMLALCGYLAVILLILCVPEPAVSRRVFYWVLLAFALTTLTPADLVALWRSPLLRVAAAFYLYLWVTLLWAAETSAPAVRGYAWRMTATVLFIALTAQLAAKRGMLGRVPFLGTVVLATAVALFSMGMHFGAEFSPGHRLGALAWQSPNSVGAAFGALAVGALAWSLGRGTPRAERLFCAGAGILLAAATLLSMSRASLVAAAVGLLVAAACARAWRLLSVCVAGLAGCAALLLLLDPARLGGLTERGTSFRTVIWENFIAQVLERPWFGYSIVHDGQTRLPDGRIVGGAHNVYLEALVFGGIPALLGLLALLFVAGRIAWRAWRQDGQVMPIAFLAFIATHGVFESQPFVHELDWHWLSFLLPFGLIAARDIAARDGVAATRSSPR